MTVETLITFSGPYTGTGAEDQEFPVEFQSASADEIEVLLDGEVVDPSAWSFDRDDDGRGTLIATLAGEVYIQSVPSFAQETDFQRYGPYFPDDVNAPLDRAAIRDQYLKDRLARSPVAPRDGSWNGMFAAVDADGNWTPASGTGADSALRADLASAAGSGASLISFKQLGNFTILRDLRARGREFKLASDVAETLDEDTDNTEAFFGFAEEISASGGGMIWLPSGNKTLLLTSMQNFPEKVRLNLNGGTLLMRLQANGTGFDPGFRLLSGCGVENGYVTMDSDSADLGSQGTQHACFVIGPMYGEGGTSASPSALHAVEDFYLRGLVISSNASGKVAIALIGGVHDGEIGNIYCPDPADLVGIVNMDWGSVGSIDTSGGGDPVATAAAIAATRTAFNAGTAWTLHPHGISVSRVHVGSMTYAEATVVRLSSVYDVSISHVYADEVNGAGGAAILLTGGDVGREFMLTADVSKAMKNITVDHCHFPDCGVAYSLRVDSYGDNISVAVGQGYVPRFNPVIETNLVVRDCSFASDGGASVVDGATLSYMIGGTVKDCTFRGFKRGLVFEAGCVSTVAHRVTTIYNREQGQLVNGTAVKPDGCRIEKAISYYNDQTAGGYANVALLSAKNCIVDGGNMGNPYGGTESGTWGIRLASVSDGGDNNSIVGRPKIDSHKAGGAAVTIGTTSSFGCCRVFTGADYGAGVTVTYDVSGGRGLAVLPVARNSATGLATYEAASAATLTGLVVAVGETIKFTNAAASASPGMYVTTAGTVGGAARFADFPVLGSAHT